MLLKEAGECGRLRVTGAGPKISAGGAGRGVSERSALLVLVRCRTGGDVIPSSSGDETSLDDWVFIVDCLEPEDVVGVGDRGSLLGRDLSGTGRGGGGSKGDGKFWITSKSSLLVRRAADWIMATWCARLGRIAGIRRGVNGTMTSCAKLRNSANHLSAVDCWISSSINVLAEEN